MIAGIFLREIVYCGFIPVIKVIGSHAKIAHGLFVGT